MISIVILTAFISSFITIIVPHVIEQNRRTKAFKQQELIHLIESIVEQKLKQIVND
jgi:hypothetical protein